MSGLKIIHVIQGIVVHGAEKMLVDMAIYQKKAGNDVIVVSQYSRQENEYEKMLDDAGIRTVYFGKPLGFNFKHMLELTRFMKKEKPDVVHTHLHAAVYLLPYYMYNRKCAKVHTVHSVATYELGKAHRLLQGFAYRFLGVVPVSISDSVKKSMTAEYGSLKDPPVIYNSIIRSSFCLPKVRHDHFVFINVASHTDVKNQALLLKAFANVVDRRDFLRLRLVGDGPNRKTLERLANELKISEYVEFMGIRHDIPLLLASSDAFVLSSDTEGMSLSLLEAIAAGLPVISTDVGGSRDIIKNGESGFIIPVGDQNAMSEKMELLAVECEMCRKISEHNREYSKKFDFEVMNEKYIKLYHSLLQR